MHPHEEDITLLWSSIDSLSGWRWPRREGDQGDRKYATSTAILIFMGITHYLLVQAVQFFPQGFQWQGAIDTGAVGKKDGRRTLYH